MRQSTSFPWLFRWRERKQINSAHDRITNLVLTAGHQVPRKWFYHRSRLSWKPLKSNKSSWWSARPELGITRFQVRCSNHSATHLLSCCKIRLNFHLSKNRQRTNEFNPNALCLGNFVSKSDVFKANVCSHCLRLVLVETKMVQVKEY